MLHKLRHETNNNLTNTILFLSQKHIKNMGYLYSCLIHYLKLKWVTSDWLTTYTAIISVPGRGGGGCLQYTPHPGIFCYLTWLGSPWREMLLHYTFMWKIIMFFAIKREKCPTVSNVFSFVLHVQVFSLLIINSMSLTTKEAIPYNTHDSIYEKTSKPQYFLSVKNMSEEG